MKFGIKTLDDFQLENKTVFCRVDINSALKKDRSGLADISRLKGCAPTIKELAERKAKTVLLAHQGGDLEYHNYYSTKYHAAELSNLIGKEVKFIDDVCGPFARDCIKQLRPGEILLLDNVRYMAEEMTLFETKLKLPPEEQAKTLVVQKLAPLGDLYVCDAFAAAHRAQPTLIGFEEVLPSAMGRLFEREYSILSQIMSNPERPCLFVLGGSKIQDAFLMMSSVLRTGTADRIITGGLVANIMLLAKGVEIGRESTDYIKAKNLWDYVKIAADILAEHADKVVLPVDFAYTVSGERLEADLNNLPSNSLVTDIGHQTVNRYQELIKAAQTVFVNGPMGIFEESPTEYGTKTVWETVADSPGFSVVGGGDSIAALNKYGLTEQISYVCTGGGAMVRFLAGEELPVIKALKKAAVRFNRGGA
jgi:phosphoglycerate kinase